ncbi:hypothetical protein [Halorussus halophilus]|uniref:hypothetical protein n=1 Tax=Halorussus halophilus TaxID=2650975 RepID=UPI001300D23C|nr:hypothetical protein [Halorussus halophilus]
MYTPLSRPLFVYVDRQRLTDPLVREFCRFYLSLAATHLAADIGYVPLSEKQVRSNQRKLAVAIESVN